MKLLRSLVTILFCCTLTTGEREYLSCFCVVCVYGVEDVNMLARGFYFHDDFELFVTHSGSVFTADLGVTPKTNLQY